MLLPAFALACLAGDPDLTAADDIAQPGAPLPSGTTIGFLPRGLTSFGAAVVDGSLYVLGGYFGTPHAYSREGQSGAFVRINLYDPRDVSLLPDVEPAQSVELVAYRGQLVRVAGMHARNHEGEPTQLESSTEVSLFDPLSDEWTSLPDLPEPRSSHRAVVVGDTLYVAGGWNLQGNSKSSEWHDDVVALDLTSPESGWTSIEAPFRARALGAATVGGKLFVVGGITPDRDISKDVRIYDPETGTWSEGEPFPDFGFGITVAADGEQLYASGSSGTVYALDATGKDWTSVATLTTGRIFHELVVGGGEGSLLALGGIAGMNTSGRIRAIERVDLLQAPFGGAIERFTIPAPCATRNRFGLFAKRRSLYVFGGNQSLGDHDFDAENFQSEAWRFDLGDLTWTRLDDLPAGRQTMQTALSEEGEVAYAIGGFGRDGEGASSLATGFAYEFEFDDWVDGPALPVSRTQFGLVQHGGSMYAFGGVDFDPKRGERASFVHLTDVARCENGSEAFEATDIELPRARRAFAGALVGDRYVMVGGMRDGFELVEEVDVYDFATGEWATAAQPARPRLAADSVVLDGLVYLVGGGSLDAAGKIEPNPSIEVYDPASDSWRTLVADLGMDMEHARALEVDDKILIVSMHREGDARAEIVFVDPARMSGAD
ncbi:MAG: kelch repeat-containing protein [Planctomycetota bacterium]